MNQDTKQQTEESTTKDQVTDQAIDQTNNQAKDQNLESRLEQLQQELEKFREREKRALADYQNLVRRQRQERSRLIKFAAQDLVKSLLQPLEHLSLAAQEIKEDGLNMVVKDLWQALEEAGLKEMRPEGKTFDLEMMEAVNNNKQDDQDENQAVKPKKLKVKKVVKPGYKLNDKIIQHAKVIVE